MPKRTQKFQQNFFWLFGLPTIAKDIDKEADQYKDDFSDHPSIVFLIENTQRSTSKENFSFKPVEEKYLNKVISNLTAKNATGAYFG